MTEQWQELKETITELRDNDGTGTQQEVCKFLVNYMDVLEKQMQEPCGDAISRQAVLDLAKKGILVSNGNCKSVCKAIYELPSANPQEKIGHWISFGAQGEVDGQIVQVFTCSECGAISIFRMASGNIVNGDICPNCKANMRKESADKESKNEN